MRILYVCHRFPYPPKRGGKIRPFNMIKHLSQNHEVTVASLARTKEEADAGIGLKEHCHDFVMGHVWDPVQNVRMVSRLASLEPSSMGYFYSQRLAKEIKRRHKEQPFDMAFVHCSSVAQYVEDLDIPKILDYGDMDSQKWLIYAKLRKLPLAAGYWLEGTKLVREEKRLAVKFDLCTATTKLERDTLEGYKTGVPTDWFPNGVDHDYFCPEGDEYDPNLISFIGRMDYYPNQECMIHFCHKVLPNIQAQNPKAKLIIVGAEPAPEIWKLAELPGVEVTGSVDDVRPYIRKSAVMVAPLNIARGTQNKILEAMAMGVPVVSSQLAADGVDAEAEQHFLTANDDDGYCRQVLRLLNSTEERQKFAVAGRERMLSHHHWPNSMLRLDKIIERGLELSKNQTAA